MSGYAFAMRCSEDEVSIPLRLRTGPLRTLQRLRAILSAPVGSYPQDMRAGLPLVQWASRNGPTPVEAEAYIRDQIRRSGERVDVLQVDVVRSAVLEITVRLSIPDPEAEGGRTLATLGMGPRPGAWYIIERAP